MTKESLFLAFRIGCDLDLPFLPPSAAPLAWFFQLDDTWPDL
jgi:hypothetical protein